MTVLTILQKTHSNRNQHLPEVLLSANLASHIRQLRKLTEALPQNGNRSTQHPPKSPRLRATTSAALFRSSTWHRNLRLSAAKLLRLQKLHQRRAARRPRSHQPMVISHLRLPKPRVRALRVDLLDLHVSRNDRYLTTLRLAALLYLLPVPRLAVLDFHPEAIPTDNLLLQQLLRLMQKAGFRSQRVNNTLSHPTCLNLRLLYRENPASDNPALSVHNQFSSAPPAAMRKVVIGGRTRLPRLLVV